MKITYPHFYKNKTFYYLFPVLTVLPLNVKQLIRKVFKLAVGVNDTLFQKEEGRFIFILTSNKHEPINFEIFLKEIKTISDYVTDYSVTNNTHMIVLKIPKGFEETFDNFIAGRYSKMYTEEFLLSNTKVFNPVILDILLLKDSAKNNYMKHLENVWGITDNVDLTEYDEPPKCVEEIFNYKAIKPIYTNG